MFADSIEILWRYRHGFALGLAVTVKLAAFIWVAGLLAGTLLGVLATKLPRSVGRPLRWSALLLSAIPAIVLLFWAYFPLQILLRLEIEPFWTAAGTLALLNTVSVAEVVRGLFSEFPRQFRDAAKVCGLSAMRSFVFVELPLVARQAVPPLLILQVNMLHLTLFASFISVEDVFRVAQRINSTVYRPVEIYSALAVLFIAVSLPLQLLAGRLRAAVGSTLEER